MAAAAEAEDIAGTIVMAEAVEAMAAREDTTGMADATLTARPPRIASRVRQAAAVTADRPDAMTTPLMTTNLQII
ncbi:hypothetical protein D3C77_555870 [compost metagenome]